MIKKSVKFEISDYLQSEKDIQEYINSAIEDGDDKVLLLVLKDVIRSVSSMTKLAKKTGLKRESLYTTLSENGNPRLSSLVSILDSLNLRIKVESKTAEIA